MPYRWDFVRVRLLHVPGEGPHPATSEWEQYYRRTIPGATRGEQLAAVQSWLAANLQDPAGQDAVVYGARRPSTLETIIGTAQAGRRARIDAALEPFLNCGWAVSHLDPPPDEPAPE
jgi:hypothetical protein